MVKIGKIRRRGVGAETKHVRLIKGNEVVTGEWGVIDWLVKKAKFRADGGDLFVNECELRQGLELPYPVVMVGQKDWIKRVEMEDREGSSWSWMTFKWGKKVAGKVSFQLLKLVAQRDGGEASLEVVRMVGERGDSDPIDGRVVYPNGVIVAKGPFIKVGDPVGVVAIGGRILLPTEAGKAVEVEAILFDRLKRYV